MYWVCQAEMSCLKKKTGGNIPASATFCSLRVGKRVNAKPRELFLKEPHTSNSGCDKVIIAGCGGALAHVLRQSLLSAPCAGGWRQWAACRASTFEGLQTFLSPQAKNELRHTFYFGVLPAAGEFLALRPSSRRRRAF